jgi:penicillin-binding protein 1C
MSLVRIIARIQPFIDPARLRRDLWRQRRRRWIAAGVTLTLLTLGLWAAWEYLKISSGEPAPEALADPWFRGHRILDRNGIPLRELPAEEGRRGRWTTLPEIGDRITLATLAAEDASFFEHDGVDRVALLRALSQNLRHGRLVSGGSTITQQLVKLLDTRGIAGERTVPIKLREMARAHNLEQELTKEQILEEYMNRLPYGHGLVGPAAAADGYFGVRARDLSWGQATYLAVLPRAPSYLDPYRHPERVKLRQRALLDEMEELGMLTEVERRRAEHEPVDLETLRHPFSAPHFVEMLRAEDRLSSGDATTTTLDLELQRDVEGLVDTQLSTMKGKLTADAAAIVVDNATGDVLAYVGSADFHDPAISGQVDMVRARRQPGSALKPFVYALAFERGHTPHEMLADVPTEFSERGGEIYAPRNFHGDFAGPIPARDALAASLNVPVVRLASDLPAGALLAQLHALGFDSLDQSAQHYGLSLSLGSGEVELRELAAAYVALARGGEKIPLRFTAGSPRSTAVPVIDPAIAATIVDALSDPLARVRLLRGRSPFDIGYPIALKTGTSSGYRDAWTVGFTHERTVAVWVGNADGSAMHEVTGASGAGPLFADVMRRAMEDVRTRGALFDAGLLTTLEVCPLTGLPVSEACPEAVTRRFAPQHAPSEPCSVHVHAQRQEHSGGDRWVCRPEAETSVAILPSDYDRWLEAMPLGAPGKDPAGIAWVSRRHTQACGDDESVRPTLSVDSPAAGSVFLRTDDGTDRDRVELSARYEGPAQLRPKRVEFVVDGRVVARSGEPYRVLVPIGPGDHDVYARPEDDEAPLSFRGTSFAVR